MRRGAWAVLVVSLIGPAWAAGQDAPAVEPPPQAPAEPSSSAPTVESPSPTFGPPSVASAMPETEITLDKGTQVAAGLGFGGPLGAGVGLRILHGLGADVREGQDRVKAVCAVPIAHCAQGFLVQADAGSGGGKLSLGIGARARVNEEDFRGTVGASLRLALARTWGRPIGTEPGLTYLGPELDLSIVRVNVTLGVLWRVSGQGGASALFSWGLGFGL